MPEIQVVTVNYKTAPLVVESLRALAKEAADVPLRVTVVDNDSQDDSLQTIQGAIDKFGWGGWASVLALNENKGFGSGNNTLIRRLLSPSGPDFFLLLNPDTRVLSGAIKNLMNFAQNNNQAGILGSRLEHSDGEVQISSFRFFSILSEFEAAMQLGIVSKLLSPWAVAPPAPDIPTRVDWVAGACMLIRREVFEQVGLFDENYFLYYEESDLCKRAASKGWQCWYVPSSRVVHLRGSSSGVTTIGAESARMPQYWFDSRRYYFIKHHGIIYCFLADLAWIVGYVFWTIRIKLQRKKVVQRTHLFRDFIGNSVIWKAWRS